MPLFKSSQVINDVPDVLLAEDEVIMYEEKSPEEVGEDVIEINNNEPQAVEFSFKLPHLPGALEEVPLEVSTDDVEVDESKKEDAKGKGKGSLKGETVEEFLETLKHMLSNVPKHSGYDTTGIERAISYLKKADNEISKAIQSDYNGVIDSSKAEEARSEIYDGIQRLEDRLEVLMENKYKGKKKKKAEQEAALIKESQKATHVGGIIVTVPLLISRLARVCINGTISGGHDLEDMFKRQVKKYALNDREQAELMQLLFDMNMPLGRLDRGYIVDDKEDFDPKSSNNYDLAANYPS